MTFSMEKPFVNAAVIGLSNEEIVRFFWVFLDIKSIHCNTV